jgi:hypothetical protein
MKVNLMVACTLGIALDLVAAMPILLGNFSRRQDYLRTFAMIPPPISVLWARHWYVLNLLIEGKLTVPSTLGIALDSNYRFFHGVGSTFAVVLLISTSVRNTFWLLAPPIPSLWKRGWYV